MSRRQISVVCGIRGCRRHFSDRLTLEQHLTYDHPVMVFRGPNRETTPCPWRHCSARFNTPEPYRAHVLTVHLRPLNIREYLMVQIHFRPDEARDRTNPPN
ncbi:unnamed protein product [Caenorhabditis angaria]|uniref:C2H2-type domain-containing protein n=1 Tax=Caenorhabditis angaria TaxID=860376 RepID=A0A9P1N255_9PELO|nr:unnamed protein product [Caenorhabditis angaria]